MKDDQTRGRPVPLRKIGYDRVRAANDGIERGRIATDTTRRLPHERDEYPDRHDARSGATTGPRTIIDQASADVGHGLRDTEQRGISSDVPAPDRDRGLEGMQLDESQRTSRGRRRRTKDHR